MADKFKIRNAARRILWRWANTTEVLQKLERERSFFRRMSVVLLVALALMLTACR